MVKYRRHYLSGGTYFFTVTLQDRKSNWLVKYIQQLKNAMHHVHNIYPFKTQALVVLPDHLHTIWKLPEHDSNYSLRWRLIKTQFAKNIIQSGRAIIKNHRNEYLLWQRRFWEHTIQNEIDYEQHVNYIHFNPIKHAYVKKALDWPFSTFHAYVAKGLLSRDWYQEENLYDED